MPPFDFMELLNLSYVKRWAISPMYREYSVAEHTFRVLIIELALAIKLNLPFDEEALLWDVIAHDLDEVYSGDMPGTHKDRLGTSGLKDISTMTGLQCLIKVADSIETGTWGVCWGAFHLWNHRDNNCPARDLAKIKHYGAKIPGLTKAAMEVWHEITSNQPSV